MRDSKDFWEHEEQLRHDITKFLTDNPLSLDEFARRSDVHMTTLKNVLRGRRYEFKTWIKIYKYLDSL